MQKSSWVFTLEQRNCQNSHGTLLHLSSPAASGCAGRSLCSNLLLSTSPVLNAVYFAPLSLIFMGELLQGLHPACVQDLFGLYASSDLCFPNPHPNMDEHSYYKLDYNDLESFLLGLDFTSCVVFRWSRLFLLFLSTKLKGWSDLVAEKLKLVSDHDSPGQRWTHLQEGQVLVLLNVRDLQVLQNHRAVGVLSHHAFVMILASSQQGQLVSHPSAHWNTQTHGESTAVPLKATRGCCFLMHGSCWDVPENFIDPAERTLKCLHLKKEKQIRY